MEGQTEPGCTPRNVCAALQGKPQSLLEQLPCPFWLVLSFPAAQGRKGHTSREAQAPVTVQDLQKPIPFLLALVIS